MRRKFDDLFIKSNPLGQRNTASKLVDQNHPAVFQQTLHISTKTTEMYGHNFTSRTHETDPHYQYIEGLRYPSTRANVQPDWLGKTKKKRLPLVPICLSFNCKTERFLRFAAAHMPANLYASQGCLIFGASCPLPKGSPKSEVVAKATRTLREWNLAGNEKNNGRSTQHLGGQPRSVGSEVKRRQRTPFLTLLFTPPHNSYAAPLFLNLAYVTWSLTAKPLSKMWAGKASKNSFSSSDYLCFVWNANTVT